MRPDPTRCLLLIDDEPAQRRLVTAIGARAGWWVRGAPDIDAAAAILAEADGPPVDAILLDHWLPGPDGTAVIEQIRAMRPDLPLLVMTAQTSVAVAVEAMRAGAHDFLVKPIAPDSMLAALNAATDRRQRGGGELRPLSEKISNRPLAFEEIVGSAPPLRSALPVPPPAPRPPRGRRQGRPGACGGPDRGRGGLGQGSVRAGDPHRISARPQADDH